MVADIYCRALSPLLQDGRDNTDTDHTNNISTKPAFLPNQLWGHIKTKHQHCLSLSVFGVGQQVAWSQTLSLLLSQSATFPAGKRWQNSEADLPTS